MRTAAVSAFRAGVEEPGSCDFLLTAIGAQCSPMPGIEGPSEGD
jgi:hypothetical protein